MTLPSVTSTSTSQYSAETLITILDRPSTSLSQSVDVVMETPDPEVILPERLPTVAARLFVRLCDPLAVTLPLHSTPLEPPSSQETPVRFGMQHISSVSGQSPGPPVLSPQIPFSQPTPSRIPETYMGHQQEPHLLPEVYIGPHRHGEVFTLNRINYSTSCR